MMKKDFPELLVADADGAILNVPFLEGCGMKAGRFFRFLSEDLKKLPPCSPLVMLPDRLAVGLDPVSGECVHLEENPLASGGPCFPVAALLAPGYTATFSAAFLKGGAGVPLPLFSYAAVVFYKGEFYTASVQVDREFRQDPRRMDAGLMRKNIKAFQKMFPGNRLIRHLENCACVNGCPAAKNFFLKRYEAPLPVSPSCNCQCRGCISYQPEGKIPATQPRIEFVPTPEEIAEVALFHIAHVKEPVVSFGQGCEGEPLMEAAVIEKAVRMIRAKTGKGMIHLNTNASRPSEVSRLCAAGLNSMRVSLNSLQENLYHAYYRPRGYTFKDVVRSVGIASDHGACVSLNYLVMPGLTDSLEEYQALNQFLSGQGVRMIQWRNLNFDPLEYFRVLKCDPDPAGLLGVDQVIRRVHCDFPQVMKGYFNPSRERFRRHARRLSGRIDAVCPGG